MEIWQPRDRNIKTRLIVFIIALQLLFTGLASARELASVAVVNVTFLMENAPQSEAASNLLKEKFMPQEKRLAEQLDEINKLEAELEKNVSVTDTNGDMKRQKERELRSKKRKRSRSLQDFREELRFARNAALDDVQKEVFNAIAEVRKEQNVDIVLQDYVSAGKSVDITPLVLAYLKSQLESVSETGEKSPQ